MKTDFNSILKLLQANKAKKITEGFTTTEFAEQIGCCDREGWRKIKSLISEGIVVFAGKANRMNICGVIHHVPIYKLTAKK